MVQRFYGSYFSTVLQRTVWHVLMKNTLVWTMCTILQFKNAMNIVFNFLTKQSWDTCFVPVLVIPRMLPSSKSGRTKNNKRFFFSRSLQVSRDSWSGLCKLPLSAILSSSFEEMSKKIIEELSEKSVASKVFPSFNVIIAMWNGCNNNRNKNSL